MRIIQMLFLLISRFVPVSPTEIQDLQNEANGWLSSLGSFEDIKAKKDRKEKLTLKELFVFYERFWVVRTLLAISYVPLVRWFSVITEPPKDEGTEKDAVLQKINSLLEDY